MLYNTKIRQFSSSYLSNKIKLIIKTTKKGPTVVWKFVIFKIRNMIRSREVSRRRQLV